MNRHLIQAVLSKLRRLIPKRVELQQMAELIAVVPAGAYHIPIAHSQIEIAVFPGRNRADHVRINNDALVSPEEIILREIGKKTR